MQSKESLDTLTRFNRFPHPPPPPHSVSWKPPRFPLSRDCQISYCHGHQAVSKYSYSDPRVAALQPQILVNVLLAVVRIPCVTTDLVITCNLPAASVSGSVTTSTSTPVDTGVAVVENDETASVHLLRSIVESLQIHDFGLFAT